MRRRDSQEHLLGREGSMSQKDARSRIKPSPSWAFIAILSTIAMASAVVSMWASSRKRKR